MKFNIAEQSDNAWVWQAVSGTTVLFGSSEPLDKASKVATVIRKNIVREDDKLEAALVKALKTAGLNEKGGKIPVL